MKNIVKMALLTAATIRLSETSPGCARAVLLAWPLRSLPAVAAW